MTTPSTVLAVRKDLVARFARYLDAAGITECPTFRGHPGQVIPLRFVAVSTTAEGTERENARLPFGAGSISETYELEIVIWQADQGGYDVDVQAACTEMVWQIAGLLDEQLRSAMSEWRLEDPNTGAALVTSAYFVGFEDDEYLLAEGRAAQIKARLRVTSAKN